MHRAMELRGDTLLRLLEATGALRQPERLEPFIRACEADSRGRLGMEDREYPQADYLREAQKRASAITAADVKKPGLEGKAIGEALRKARIRGLNQLRAESAGNKIA
jgi:tRNA nucleotidyltransferase (CCA-adding enzyme)